MSNVLDKTPTIQPQPEALDDALTEVTSALLAHMKPKAIAKVRREMERFADRLEAWEGCRVHGPNVLPLRGPSRFEQALASEGQRRERAERAAAIRLMIGKVF